MTCKELRLNNLRKRYRSKKQSLPSHNWFKELATNKGLLTDKQKHRLNRILNGGYEF
jgi:hypothetical protein